MRKALLGLLGIAFLAAPWLVSGLSPQSVLDRMLAARETGRVAGTAYYATTSADVPAYYLMAYSWASSVPAGRRNAAGRELEQAIWNRAVRSGPCVGWGLGTALDAFGDGSVNGADTIYLYTTARVATALLEAEKAGLISNDRAELNAIACSLRTLFGFDPTKPVLNYSDNANDAGYVVFNVFADLIRTSILLGRRLQDPALGALARQACEVLISHVGEDGFLPYFIGKQGTDPTHHAMVINGLLDCREEFGIGAPQTIAAGRYLIGAFFDAGGRFDSSVPDPEWAAGESLVALSRLCGTLDAFCRARDALLVYVRAREIDGLVNNDSARFQSWLAAGLAFAENPFRLSRGR